ncbi:MAG: type I methionyl aminopeptidase [Bacilli bacterium]|nr:type I methionyl aminopeptidase [Bacilli bacterium]
MISIKSEREINLIKESGHLNYLTHELLKKHLKPGITTNELDKIAYDFITKNGGYPSCLNYEGFPKSICVSINDEVVHGIPSNRKIKNGDVVSIDFCVLLNGYHSDSARTYIVGDTTEEVKDLVKNTEEALYVGLQQIKEGAKIGDVGAAIQEYAEAHGLGVVRELVGHGIGTEMHEDPDVPNYGTKGTGKTLKAGMVIAVEPMITLGDYHVGILEDDWTIVTQDGLPSAHFEHTVVVTKDGYEILTKE